MHLNSENELVTQFSAKAFCPHGWLQVVTSLIISEVSHSDTEGVNILY